MTTFFLFSLQVLRQSQHIAHNVRHSDFRHFHCRHFDFDIVTVDIFIVNILTVYRTVDRGYVCTTSRDF